MAITNITESSTFRAWYQVTNEMIDNLNANVVINGGDVYGAFKIKAAANTYLSVANSLYVNMGTVSLLSNTTFAANVVANSSVGAFTIQANSFVVAPLNGTRIDTPTLVNAALFVNAAFSVNGVASVNGTVMITGDTTLSGNTTANGLFTARQVIYAATGAVAANTLSATTYDDFNVVGLANCAILNLTPSGPTAITGIVAPGTIGAAGGRVLHLQNLSDTYSINLYSANLSSSVGNRFRTPGDTTIQIGPGTALSLIYTKTNAQWRILAPQIQAGGSQTFSGQVDITGNLNVFGNATFSANVSMAPLYIDRVNSRVGIGTATPAYPFHATTNAYFGATLTAVGNTAVAQLAASGNVSFFTGGVVFNALANTVYTANTISANGTAASFIRNLSGNTIAATQTLSTANLGVSGTATLSGGRLVIPVGTNYYAT